MDADYAIATVTIYDDDLPTVGVTASQPTTQESGGSGGQFTVSLDNNVRLGYDLVVPYTLGGLAVNGQGYQMLSGDVTIPAQSITDPN